MVLPAASLPYFYFYAAESEIKTLFSPYGKHRQIYLVNPGAQDILDIVEDNPDFYQSKITSNHGYPPDYLRKFGLLDELNLPMFFIRNKQQCDQY